MVNIPSLEKCRKDGNKLRQFSELELIKLINKLNPREREIFGLYQEWAIIGAKIVMEKYKK